MANLDYEKYFGKSRAENYAKAQLKKELILKFLYEETFSDSRTLAALLDLGTQSTNQTLGKMELAGLLKSYMIDITGTGVSKKYWGITTLGGELAAYELRLDPNQIKPFEKRMVNAVSIRHRLATQHLIVNRNLALGVWGELRLGKKPVYMPSSDIKYVRSMRWIESKGVDLSVLNIRKRLAVPDIFIYAREDAVWAVEVELTIKKRGLYKTILQRHLFNIQKGISGRVIYVLETDKKCAKLREIINEVARSDPEWVEMVEKRFEFMSFEEIGQFKWVAEENIA